MAPQPPRLPLTDHDAFVNIARLIVGHSPACSWLAESLRKQAGSVFLDRHVHTTQPSRAEVRKVVERMLNGDLTEDNLLREDPVMQYLDAFGEGPIEARCRWALQSLQTETGQTRRGPGKATPPDGVDPMTYCALLVAEAWEKLHGKRPPSKSSRASAAAEQLWRASSGDGHYGEDEPFARWRYHFKLAARAEQRQLRMEFRRRLSLSEHFSKQRPEPPPGNG